MFEQNSPGFHCSLDQRSWTDPVTNSTFFSATQSVADLKTFFTSPGDLPEEFGTTFLHESSHHWCFHSRVGMVLAWLQMQACEYASHMSASRSSRDADKVEELGLLEYLIRYTTAVDLMRPLAEGLALFAQFDVAPGNSPVRSGVMESVFQLLGFQALQFTGEMEFANPEDRIDQTISLVLATLRLNKAAVESKAGLLASPLSDAKGGYSLGYLFVRSLQHRALAISRRFYDSDFFLTYLRCFFYDDLGLVAVLLDPHTQGMDSANAILSYFEDRLEQCFRSDQTDEMQLIEWAKVEKSHEERSYDSINRMPSLVTEEQVARLGQERLQAILNYVYSDSRESSRFRNFLGNRSIINIGRFNASIEITAKNSTESAGRYQFTISEDEQPVSQGGFPIFVGSFEKENEMEFFVPIVARQNIQGHYLGSEKETGIYT